ncbi:hypothetical protein HPB50_021552 [Hyalomma asiaticum]|uniref:Uncharacterized protein n=1 Tax=Hyalomma asiaticum TaxID=266040 RepID=A0ACB7S8F1_HYAAI|nr:hypothetical protein HPB50_021552 [Hyalomma asiaticum]
MAAPPGIELKEKESGPARAIIRGIRNRNATLFVDAAEYHCKTAFAVAVVDGGGNAITTATIRTNSVSVAEEAAIALALQVATTPATIYSDSRMAVRAFSAGTVSSLAARIVRAIRNSPRWAVDHNISWFPAHMEGLSMFNPDIAAHTLARECTNRAKIEEATEDGLSLERDPLTTYHEITNHYRLGRRLYPLPNARLNRAQGVTLWRLQTGIYPSPRSYHRIEPYFPPGCPKCGLESCNLQHMLWKCPANARERLNDEESWSDEVEEDCQYG